jgi:hypothetical protein
MSPQQAAAITNNEKVFPVFAKKLSSNDGNTFCNAAAKLSKWLNSDKAYYAAARPKVSLSVLSFKRSMNGILDPDCGLARGDTCLDRSTYIDRTTPAAQIDSSSNTPSRKGRGSGRANPCSDIPSKPDVMGNSICCPHSNSRKVRGDVFRGGSPK